MSFAVARTNCLPVNSTLCRMQIRTNPQCTICTNNYEENVNHVLLECEAYTNLRNELLGHNNPILWTKRRC